MKRRTRLASGRRNSETTTSRRDPEVVAFIAAILRQMDHAANLVVAFFRSIGMMGPHETLLPQLPGELLLELAALLQVREWQAGGVINSFDPEGLSIDDRIGEAIERLRDDPLAMINSRRGTQGMIGVVRHWNESCCLAAREHLGCDVALHWDASLDMDHIVDVFANFLCRHRDTGHSEEEK